jgi:hypothetical protein
MPPTTMITVAERLRALEAAPDAAGCTMGTVNVRPDVASPAETREVLGIRPA